MNFLYQIIQFGSISGIGWILDFILFNLLHYAGFSLFAANVISSLLASSFVFALCTRKTFVQKEGGVPLRLKFALYAAEQLVLIFLMSRLLSVIDNALEKWISHSSLVAKILITPITMFLNFFVMKLLIERI